MDEVSRLVRVARRRLTVERWLRALPWCLSAGLLVSCVLLALDRWLAWGLAGWIWPSAGAAVGLLAATVWAWWTRAGALEAAIEIDRRFQLKERVSSSYALAPDELETPAGRALAHDASSRLERLPLAGQFRLSPSRWSWLPILPAMLAVSIALVLHPAADARRQAEAATVASQQKQQIERSTEKLHQKLIQQREAAKQQGLKSADDLFSRLEQETQQLNQAQSADRKQALVKLNDLAGQLAQRQAEMAATNKLAEQLRQLKSLGQGPADPLAKALEQGDLAAAAREIRALAEQLKSGNLDAAQQKHLERQLKQLGQKLDEMADAQRKLEQQLKQQIADHRAAGRDAQADRLEQQLHDLGLQQQAQSMKKMAEKLGRCAECMQAGQDQQAAAGLSELQNELDQLSGQLAESQMLDQAQDAIADAKDSMTCKHCGGMGCRHCAGHDHAQANDAAGGRQWGRGEGQLLGPEEKAKTPGYDTRVRQKIGRGPAVVTDLVSGANARGRAEQQIREQWSGAAGGQADPLDDQPLPADYRQHAKNYFDTLREGR